MLTVSLVLVVTAFATAVAAAMGKCPLWVSAILLCLYALLQVIPK